MRWTPRRMGIWREVDVPLVDFVCDCVIFHPWVQLNGDCGGPLLFKVAPLQGVVSIKGAEFRLTAEGAVTGTHYQTTTRRMIQNIVPVQNYL